MKTLPKSPDFFFNYFKFIVSGFFKPKYSISLETMGKKICIPPKPQNKKIIVTKYCAFYKIPKWKCVEIPMISHNETKTIFFIY